MAPGIFDPMQSGCGPRSAAQLDSDWEQTMICRVFLIVSLVALALPAQGRTQASLGALNVPAERVPDWNIVAPTDTRSWPAYNVVTEVGALNSAFGSSCNPAVLNDGLGDDGNIQCMINAVAGTSTVLVLPAGRLDILNKGGLRMPSGVVLRGFGPSSLFHFEGTANFTTNSCKSMTWINFTGTDGASTAWTGGYSRGNRVLEVSDASLFAIGDWVRIHMNDDPNLTPLNSSAGTPGRMEYTVKVAAVNSTSSPERVTIDRPLRLDYTTAGGRTVTKVNPITGSGLENFKIVTEGSTSGSHQVCMKRAVGNWVVNMEVGPYPAIFVFNDRSSARNLMQHNFVHDTTGDQGFNTYPFSLQYGASDNHVHNNRFTNISKAIVIQTGAIGNLVTYNYGRDCSGHRRLVFFHGEYPSETLVEGNVVDTDCNIDMDNHWGPQGERNTFYRNRSIDDDLNGRPDSIRSHSDDSQMIIATQPNMILNFTPAIYQSLGCKSSPGDYDNGRCDHWDFRPGHTGHSTSPGKLYIDAYAERNVGYDVRSADQCVGDNNPYTCCPYNSPAGVTEDSCVFGNSFHTSLSSSDVENYQRTDPAPSWSSESYPYSLAVEWNRPDVRPSGWCQEITQWPAIGADVDSLPISALPKMPAHAAYDGDPCTPWDDNGIPVGSRPDPPELLP